MAFIRVFVVACLFFALAAATKEQVEHGAHANKAKRIIHGIYNPVFDKEALLGSRHTDELEDLPDETRLKRLRILAKAHDVNNNNIIEADELKEWILQSFRMLDSEEAIEKLREEDENGDNKLSLDEILQKQFGHSDQELEEMAKQHDEDDMETVKIAEEDRERFKAADLNKDGFLDDAEYIPFFQPYDYPHMHEVEMARSMKDLDRDRDGSVTLAEFTGDEDDEEAKQADQVQFAELDKDEDGKLTPEELRPWAMPDNNDVATEELEHLIKTCDENGDGHLSIDEIVTKEDEFMRSSATDYGRSLHFVKEEL